MTGGVIGSEKKAYEFELEDIKNGGKVDYDEASYDADKCGLACFSPDWIQRFATKKSFVLVFSLLGVIQGMGWSYFTATISTLEKRFKISTQTAGIVMTGNEVSQILFSIFLSYYGANAHRPRWIAVGVFLSGISSYILASPHAFYGSGRDALELTTEYSGIRRLETADIFAMSHDPSIQHIAHKDNSSAHVVESSTQSNGNSLFVKPFSPNVNLCKPNDPVTSDTCVDQDENLVPLVLIFMSQFVSGIGVLLFFTLGGPYMDDNTKRKNIAMLFGITMSLRLIGPTFGFALASGALRMYVNPLLTPTITQQNPRWIGAWWLGWVILGSLMIAFSVFIAMFPKNLKKNKGGESIADLTSSKLDTPPKFSEIPQAVKLLLKNKINVINNLAGTFYLFSGIGYWTYMPKYMETIFMQTASNSSIISGIVGIFTQAAGLLLSGFLISRYQFSARKLAFWNVVTGTLCVCVKLGLTQLGCDMGQLSFGSQNTTNGIWNLTTDCNVDCNCKTSKIFPVCYEEGNIVYYSACHAGCQSFENDGKIGNCKCLPNVSDTVTLGTCSSGCAQIFTIFLVVTAIIKFIDATGRIGNMLVSYRCVKVEERSLSIGIHILVLSAFALLPAPIVFGRIIDNVCIVWGGAECGKTGNCMLYDGHQLRYIFNVVAAGFMLIGVIFDFFVWYFVKDLDLYKE